jgi:hypothetical protein
MLAVEEIEVNATDCEDSIGELTNTFVGNNKVLTFTFFTINRGRWRGEVDP